VGGFSNLTNSFLYDGGTFTTIDYPSASTTFAGGINDSGQIVGSYSHAAGIHGFLYNNGTFTSFDDPSATGFTSAGGINNSGQIVGSFADAAGTHGFLATPTPEPGTLPLLAGGLLIGIVMASRQNQRRRSPR
jgi:probable HAF family extracellular repeat protein